MIRVTVSGGDLFNDLWDDEDKKLATDLFSDLVQNTPVDTGALRQAWDLDLSGQPTVSNPLPYAETVMNNGHSKQAPAGTLDLIVDKYTR